MTFENLNLIKPLLVALNKKGYTEPTPVQVKAIPTILAGRDIFGCAQTGTGKTAAFALPILQLLNERKVKNERTAIKALVITPTRELAVQISREFVDYGSQMNLKQVTVYGGVSQSNQTRAIRSGIDILIATPGRLLDLMQQGFINLDKIEFLVLDEADRMLDMGFIQDIKRIIAHIPSKRQTLLFSATAPAEIRKLAAKLLTNPVDLNLSPDSLPPVLVSQSVYHVKKENKKLLLSHLLKNDAIELALVFTRTKRGADRVVKDLLRNGVKAESIHGDKSQNAREQALRAFKKRTIRVLVATDVASRGIDVERLTHVINFEIPEQAETYVHRIGRTGRAGLTGTALSFCSADERVYLRNIHKLIHKNIDVVSSHPFAINYKS